MNLDEEIKRLCLALIQCKSDEEEGELVRELQPLLQRRLEELRVSADGDARLAPSAWKR
jgi:hypothetical protein